MSMLGKIQNLTHFSVIKTFGRPKIQVTKVLCLKEDIALAKAE